MNDVPFKFTYEKEVGAVRLYFQVPGSMFWLRFDQTMWDLKASSKGNCMLITVKRSTETTETVCSSRIPVSVQHTKHYRRRKGKWQATLLSTETV